MLPEPAPAVSPPQTTSWCSPLRCPRDVAGLPAKAIVCPYPASRYGVQVPASRPPPFDRAYALWQDRPRQQGALSAPCQAGKGGGGDCRPAGRFAIAMRGCIEKGYYADITLFDSERVVDTVTFDDPRKHPASILYVPVNGQVADNDRCTGVLSDRRCHESNVEDRGSP